MGLFRRRQPDPIPVVIVKQQPRRGLPIAAGVGLAVIAAVFIAAQLNRVAPSVASGASSPPRATAPAFVAPTPERGLDAAIAAATARFDKRTAENDAKCDAMTDPDKADACLNRSDELVDQTDRFLDCVADVLRVVDVARCEAAAQP